MDEKYNILGVYTYAEFLRKLQSGCRLAYVMEYRDGTHHLQTVLSADDEYIRWNCFGSSANMATAKDLEFVVTRIFKMSLDEIIRRYVWV